MTKKNKLVFLNLIIWPLVFAFMFFDEQLLVGYHQLLSGADVKLGGARYKLSESAFLIDIINENELVIGLNKDKILEIYAMKRDSSYFNELQATFPETLSLIERTKCSFLENKGKDPNLPNLSWYDHENGLHFTLTDFDSDETMFDELCSILQGQKQETAN